MKKISLLLAFSALICCAMFFGCETDDPNPRCYKVSFDLDGGTCPDLTEKEVTEGETFDLTEIVPTKENHIFDGWTIDGVKIEKIVVEKDVTAKAVWEYLFELEEKSDKTYALKGIKAEYDKAELVLPEEFDCKKITAIAAGALENAKNVRSLVVGNGYKTLGAEILAPLKKLERISLPFWGTEENPNYFRTLFESGDTADDDCFVVTAGADAYLVPNALASVKVTGGSVVPETKELKAKEVVFASSEVTEIENYTFHNDPYIEKIDLSGCENIEKIGDNNFSDCENLKSVSLAGLKKLRVLGSHSFYHYVSGSNETHAFDEIDLSGLQALETVGQMSFWYLKIDELDFSETAIRAFGRQTVFHSEIGKIALPATFEPLVSDEDGEALGEKFALDYINNSEFLGYCTGLAEITVDKLSLYAKVENGTLFDYDLTTAVKYASARTDESFVAPSSLKEVAATAFENATSLKTIDLGGCKLVSIGYGAFSGCSANLAVGFDKYGYYADDGSKVSLGNGWSGNCAVTYGARYYFFTLTEKGIKDGMVVASETLSFDIAATYGDDAATVAVTVNGETLGRGENGFSATLKSGENVICAVASFGDKTSDEKRYIVTFDEKWTLETDYEEGQKIVWAAGDLKFKVSAVNAADEKQNVNGKITVAVDCGYGKVFRDLMEGFGPLTITYNADYTVATIEINSDDMLSWDYDITSAHHIRVTIKQSADVSVSRTFDAQYYEKAPAISSETPADGNTVSGEKWTISGECKAGTASFKIAEITVTVDTGWGYNNGGGSVEGKISDDGTSFEANINLARLDGSGYFLDSTSFKVKITLKLENGLTVTEIFNAVYSE